MNAASGQFGLSRSDLLIGVEARRVCVCGVVWCEWGVCSRFSWVRPRFGRSPRPPHPDRPKFRSFFRHPPQFSFFFLVFLVLRPNTILHFAPFFVHPLFPVFELHVQKWVIFVRRPCVCDTLRFESPPLRGKRIEFGTLLLPCAEYDK